MDTPPGLVDLFPAFSIGMAALIILLDRLTPPPAVRWIVVGLAALLLSLYLFGRLHLWLPSVIGIWVYALLTILSLSLIVWIRWFARTPPSA